MNFKKAVFSIFVIILFAGAGLFVFQNRDGLLSLQDKDAKSVLLFFREKLTSQDSPTNQNLITGYIAAGNTAAENNNKNFNNKDFYSSLEDFSIYTVMLSCLVAVVFFFAGISARVDSENDSRKMLVQYIKLAKQNNFKKEQVKERLSKEGWQQEKMEKALNRVDFEEE